MSEYERTYHHHDDNPWAGTPFASMHGSRHARFMPPMHGRGPWGGGGPRARRGDIRTAVLLLLQEGPMHGYQIIQELSARSGGTWRPSPGSVYPTLQLLEDEGLIAGQEAEGKRVYTLTDAGAEEAKSVAGSATPWDQLAGGNAGSSRWKLRESAGKLAVAVMQAGSSGSDEQVDRVLEILTDARKKIYAILAED